MISRRMFLAACIASCVVRRPSIPYTLVVVDMQSGFGAVVDKVQPNVLREIKTAIHDNAAIILLTTEDCGALDPGIAALTRDYELAYNVEKVADSGSKKVVRALYLHSLNRSKLVVVGCNTDLCVYRTVAGIVAQLDDTKITIGSCASAYNHAYGIAMLSKLPNVSIRG